MNTQKFAVIGNPIAHSKSPLIHHAFFEQAAVQAQLDYRIEYEKILAPLDGFASTVQRLQAEGYRGLNITVPFKFEALQYVVAHGQLRPLAQTAGAVNTMILHGGTVEGDNTDGLGLVRDIEVNAGVALKGKRVLVVGAGGAAFGILQPLVNAGPASIVIVNRTLAKAEAAVTIVRTLLAQAGGAADCRALTFESLADEPFDVVINSTSAGLTDTALPIADAVFVPGGLAYDMMYGRETPFMAQARRMGLQVVDGLGMLVEQAAAAFYLWHGVKPQTQPVIEMIRTL